MKFALIHRIDRIRSHYALKRAVRPAVFFLCMSLMLLPFIFRLDGHQHANWQQFLGRFHPAIVHLPIVLVVLVPLFEFGAFVRPPLREAAAIVLYLSLPSALVAVLLGYLLAYGSGTAGSTVTVHMWSGIILTVGIAGCILMRRFWVAGGLRWSYPVLLIGLVALTAWTGHEGGAITYGKNYLSEYAPWRKVAVVPTSASFYAQHIHPIFDANCVACHGESKSNGGLRLDSFDQLMRGGREGSTIVPGHPEQSVLFKRITLPATDKHFMPAEGKPPLQPLEVAWIKAWILDGASESATSVAGVVIGQHTETQLAQVGDYSKLSEQIRQIEKTQHIRLVPISMKPGDGLILDTTDAGRAFTDTQLAQFDQFAPYIVEVQLARTAVSDACFDMLARFPHLRAVHLEGTTVTGNGLDKLSRLSELTYLNLSGTRVTQTSVATTASMKGLQHLYLFNTPAQPTTTP